MPRTVLVIQITYLVCVSLLFILRVGTPNILFFALAVPIGLIWSVRSRGFILAFSPFVAMVFFYEQLRSIAAQLTHASIHIIDLVAWERALFGGALPTFWLQQRLGSGLAARVLWNSSIVVYGTHFVSPVLLALLIWSHRRDFYWRYIGGLLVITYLGFLGYVIFPAAPPWWAYHFGYITEPIRSHLSAGVLLQTPNPVAAMPSLHAAWALYMALIVWRLWGRWIGLGAMLLPLAMCFATVYLGHHYVIDQFAGWALTVILYVPMDWVWSRRISIEAQPV